MRLFIGVDLEQHVRAAAAGAAERLRSELDRRVPGLAARWVPGSNLHITVWFIGEVDDARRGAIVSALSDRVDLPAFPIGIRGAAAFPPSGAPRVIWFGVEQGAAAMVELYGHVARALAPLGFEPERRGYSPHLTVARVRDVPRSSTAPFRQVLGGFAVEAGLSQVTSLTLFRSHVSSRGSVYEALLRVPLS